LSGGLQAARRALDGSPAWLVGGAVRDELLGRDSVDFDVVVSGDPAAAARAVARAGGRAACFALSEEFGSWRVAARDGSWQVDVEPLRAATLEEDLALRDFTVNAIARPLAGGSAIDPLGGAHDLRARRLRMAGPSAFELDPLRVLRLVRVAVELGLRPDEQTLSSAAAAAPWLARVAGERVFVELSRVLATDAAREGIELIVALGAARVVLPELEAMRGVQQSAYHHADVYEHTLEVLDRAVELSAPGGPRGEQQRALLAGSVGEVGALLLQPLADGLTRGQALRWGALLHDAAKPATRAVRPGDGRVTFMGHDRLGAELSREVLGRLRASERTRAHVAALVRHHLRLGFLVHEPQPLDRGAVYDYLHECSPVAADVTVLSIADRLATRGAKVSSHAIEGHLELAGAMLVDALRWQREKEPAPLLRGDRLAAQLGIPQGPQLGALLAAIARARFTGEVADAEQALEFARCKLRGAPPADGGTAPALP
jgi:poly(A) polymerase